MDGRWLLVYNDTEDGRHSLAVSLSEDEGRTWKYTRHPEQKEKGKGSFSYPSMIQSADGLVHITYSTNLEGKKTIRHITVPADWVKN
jgi:predicted neuraminidase